MFDAGAADAAIALLDVHPHIRFVLTDVLLPGTTDGLKLAHHVRERFPQTALLVVSGHIPVA